MSISEITKSAETRMGKSIENLKLNLSKIRTGRAHAGILDHVTVDYYGSQVPVGQVANVSVVKNGLPVPAAKITTRFASK